MKSTFTKKTCSLLFSITILIFSIRSSLALVQQINGVTTLGWQALKNNLPANTLAIAASTDAQNPDFVAVASDTSKAYNCYLLDHANLQLGWQKKYCFLQADATNLQYGLGHFILMGTDRNSGKPVVATSGDNGRTWSQSLIFAGTGHYDNAAFSEKMGMMTGKDGAVAITNNGANWTETIPPAPNAISRKVVYTNIAPAGTPIDNQFQLCVALPPNQTTDYGFLEFHDIPVIGSLISSDGKNWAYTIPYPIMRNQLLLYQNKTFLVNDTLQGISYAYHNSTNLGEANFEGLLLNDPSLPLISVFQFASYQQNWVAVGYDLKTGFPLSVFSNALILNNNIIFSTELFPKVVRLVAANQCGFLAIADDGTSYYSPSTVTPSPIAP